MLDTFLSALGSVAMFDTSAAGGPSGLDWGRYLVVCTGLISLILLGGIGARRLLRRSVVARASRRSIQVHDVLPLGGRQKLAVVRCYDRTFVLGLGDREVTLVGELEAETDLARTREPEPAPGRGGAGAVALAGAAGGAQPAGSARKAQFADLLRRLGEIKPEAPPARARAQALRSTATGEARPGAPGSPARSVEEPAAATPARPTTVAEALRGEGLLG